MERVFTGMTHWQGTVQPTPDPGLVMDRRTIGEWLLHRANYGGCG